MNIQSTRESLVAIANLLTPGDTVLSAEVLSADSQDARQVLVRGLEAQGVLAVFDWQEDPREVRSLLEALPTFPPALSWAWYSRYESEVDDLDQSEIVERLLELIGERCAHLGVFLISVDSGGDDYAVTFITQEVYEKLSMISIDGFLAIRLAVWSGIERDIPG